jgi:DNA modification methylase
VQSPKEKTATADSACAGHAPGTKIVATEELRLYPGNPRRGDLDTIKESLQTLGQYRPLVVNRRTMQVLAGNHTLKAARELGWTEISVVFVDANEDKARRILLADNRSSDLARNDDEALAQLLEECGADLEGTGYKQADLDQLFDELSDPLMLGDEDVPPLPTEPTLKLGDVVSLGVHRLACGDARDSTVLEQLMEDECASALWTDPPYGTEYIGRTPARLQIAGDSRESVGALLADSFACVDRWLSPGAPLYVFRPSGAAAAEFFAAFLGQGWSLRQELVWVKDTMVLGHADYHYRHEPIMYGYKPGTGRLGRGGSAWYGGNKQVTVLEVERPRAAREHPTMKPPELIEICLRNSTRRRDLVLDPFAGSGSTLMACEHLGRSARLVELDPRYCDVIVARFEAATGRKRR